MPSVMAIVAKDAFQRACVVARGATAEVGETLPLASYKSLHKSLEPLASGGALFLVTVRVIRGHERLWLVAILEHPERRADGWYARPNATPIQDIHPVRDQLRFASGKGLTAKDGALAMSLQTPRELTTEDEAILRAAAPAPREPAAKKPAKSAASVATTSPNQQERDLLAAVYADPTADAPRLVYADWLQERGDPRGELIALQCARGQRKLTADERAREKALVDQHAAQWLGPLAGKVAPKGLQFERGFVSTAAATGPVDGEPAWSTLRKLLRGAPGAEAHVPLLETLARVSNDDVELLATRREPLAVASLTWEGPTELGFATGRWDAAAERAIAAFTRITALPSLRKLELRGDGGWTPSTWRLDEAGTGAQPRHLSWAWSCPAAAALDELWFPARYDALPAFLEAIGPSTLQRLVVTADGAPSYDLAQRVILTRDARGRFSHCDVRFPDLGPTNLEYFVNVFQILPRRLFTTVRLEVAERMWKAFNEKRRWKAAVDRQQDLVDYQLVVSDGVRRTP